MNIKVIYPLIKKQNHFYQNLRYIIRLVFLIASLICILLNVIFKGPAWSLVVIWSLISIWNIVFSLKLVEYSIFSHLIEVVFHIIVLLFLINKVFNLVFAEYVIPIVLFGFLLALFIIYYVAYDKRDRNIISILSLGLIHLVSIPYAINSLSNNNWLILSFHIATSIILLILIIINWKDFIFELRARIFNK